MYSEERKGGREIRGERRERESEERSEFSKIK